MLFNMSVCRHNDEFLAIIDLRTHSMMGIVNLQHYFLLP